MKKARRFPSLYSLEASVLSIEESMGRTADLHNECLVQVTVHPLVQAIRSAICIFPTLDNIVE